MKKICSLLFVLLFVFSLLPITAQAEKDPIYDMVLDSQGVYVLNLETDTALYEKAANTRMAPASTTKIMTALVVLEQCESPETELVTVPDTAMFSYIVEDGGVHMELSKGENFTVYDLLLGMMMNSFCDAADLLAYRFGDGNIDNFVKLMNDKAKELGLQNTNFENPHGLYEGNHYSSPRDIALFFKEAAKSEVFREIISTRNYTIPATAFHKARPLHYTVSSYYENNDYYLDCYIGGKSGFTDQSGRCLATLSEKDGLSFISVLLGANMDTSKRYPGNMAWIETRDLMAYAYEHFEVRTVLEQGAEVAKLPVTDSETVLSIIAAEEIRVLTRKDTEPYYTVSLPDRLSAEVVKDGAEVGKAQLYFNEEKGGSYPLVISWDGTPIVTKSALEKGAKSAYDSVIGIFREDQVFVSLVIALLVVVGLCIPALAITRKLQNKKIHRPKH